MPVPTYEIKYSADAAGKITFLNELSEFADDRCLRIYTVFCVPFDTFMTNLDRYDLALIELYCIRNKLSCDQITSIVELVDDKTLTGSYIMTQEFFVDATDGYRSEDIFFYDQMIAKPSDAQTVLALQVRKLCYIIINSTNEDALKHCKDALKTLEFDAMEMILQFCVDSNHVCCVKYIKEELARIYDDSVHRRVLQGLIIMVDFIGCYVMLDNNQPGAVTISGGTVSVNAERATQKLIECFI